MPRAAQSVTFTGYDMYGKPVAEVHEIEIPTRLDRAKQFLREFIFRGWWGKKIAYKIGLSKIRPITSIQVKE